MTDPKFKVGDVVRCVDDTDDYKIGSIFIITAPDNPEEDDYDVLVDYAESDADWEDRSLMFHRSLFEKVPTGTAEILKLIEQATEKTREAEALIEQALTRARSLR